MADKRISQLIERVDILNNDVLPIVASGATTTNKVTISTIQDWMQENLDVGVTSVGITLGSSGTDVSVSGSPITTSGNITINIPTASASNRGLLSSADWSTFNGKQNSITLTTSGTSGAATLVGSTLNIPNYSTGVANAYVPYVGAIGSVTLGYNSLSASQINIDGASPTGGSYLGFKHSNSVNTGTSGYTSMYTFGTNTIAFKSLSGGDSKDFSFSMVGITPNVAGGRQYTLPDASGTLALTSDLSGYVTLGTAQTITATKTFTTSGSGNTININHTSGSGIAVDISKAGNGEGLRVAKTSGSGNAVTITGGLLSAEAATLTGALNGTSASFSGAVSTTGTGLNPSLRLTNTTASTGTDWHLYSLNNGNLGIYNNTAGAYSLQIASTGAATFSSSVTAGGQVSINAGNGNQLYLNNSGQRYTQITFDNNSSGTSKAGIWFDNTSNVFDLFANTGGSIRMLTGGVFGSPALTLASTGAATFSSSVSGTSIRSSAVGSFGFNTANNGEFQIYATASNGMIMAGRGSSTDMVITNKNGADVFTIPTGTTIANFAGNVGIGTTAPSVALHVLSSNSSNHPFIIAASSSTTLYTSYRYNSTIDVGYIGNGPGLVTGGSSNDFGIRAENNLIFAISNAERMRITSGGNVLINKTSDNGARLQSNTDSQTNQWLTTSGVAWGLINDHANAGAQFFVDFRYNGTGIGTIQGNNSSVSYNTTSDYRLKENVKPVVGALSKLTELKPCTFNFIADAEEEVMGFIAHEVQEVIPQAVSGEKDGFRIEQVEVSPAELDEEGNIITEAVIEEQEVPVYQGIDHSKLVPLLVASIQELKAEIEALKSQING